MTLAAEAVAPTAPRRGELALLLQEILTATVRLRLNPEEVPTDVEAFRAQVRRLVTTANQEGRRVGYGDNDIGYALYAVVAFLDETVLTLGHPLFRSWQGKPLQEELFGINIGGDVFFQYLEVLLGREDSEALGDVLEVFQLCLLLGFRGRYGGSQLETIHTWIARLRERITRIRGAPPALAPHWSPAGHEAGKRPTDPVQRRLLVAVLLLITLAVVLFVVFRLTLGAETRAIEALTGA
jgi:type VI secretion system protein ImpK